MDLVRDGLDKKLMDREDCEMGRVDGLVMRAEKTRSLASRTSRLVERRYGYACTRASRSWRRHLLERGAQSAPQP